MNTSILDTMSPEEIVRKLEQLKKLNKTQNEYVFAWRKRNPEKMNVIRRNRYNRLKETSPDFMERERERKRLSYHRNKAKKSAIAGVGVSSSEDEPAPEML